jgi:tetratricopeptide (TPR) repeat protein
MVTAQTTPLGTRYRQLETLRQFAEARLVEQGRLAQARDRHLAWVSTLCAAVGSAARTPGAAAAFVRYCAEVDNIRAAVAHGAATGQRETALRSLADTWSGHCRRPTFEVRGWIDPVAGTPPWTAAAAEVAGLHGLIAFLEGDFERTRELVAAVPAEFAALRTVATMAWMYEHFVLGNSDAAEALILQCRDDDHAGLAVDRLYVTIGRMNVGDAPPDLPEAVRDLADRVVAESRAHGDELALSQALTARANALVYLGDFAGAQEAAAEAARIADRYGALFVGDNARAAIGRALAGEAAAGGRDASLVARDAIEVIDDARQHQIPMTAAILCDAASLLIADHDAETAYLLGALFRKHWGVTRALGPNVAWALTAERVAELDAAAAAISLDDAVTLAAESLDRIYPSP